MQCCGLPSAVACARASVVGAASGRSHVCCHRVQPRYELLADLDWVSRLDEGGDARHVLLCDPAATRLEPLVDRTLLQPGASSKAFRSATGMQRLTLAEALA